jgi:polar amino acid transport system permease protein
MDDTPPTTSSESQAERIYQRQQRQNVRFKRGVIISWAVLLALLLFAFSGVNFSILGLKVKTIELDFGFMLQWTPYIFIGVRWTILLSISSIILASIFALLGALGRMSKFPPAYALSTFYVSLIRGTPLYLQIIFFFLALPQMGVQLSGLWAGVVALGLNYGAYMTEIMRAGIGSVPIGQREAALAIGMTRAQIMRRVVLPQAFQVVIPPIGNQFIAMLKDTALVSVTGFVHEILWNAQQVGRQNFRSLEALLVAALFYWIITIIFEIIQSRVEVRLSKGKRR